MPRLQERNPAPGGLSQSGPVRDSGGSQATPPGKLPYRLLLYFCLIVDFLLALNDCKVNSYRFISAFSSSPYDLFSRCNILQ